MQMDEAAELRRRWKEKGEPPCSHSMEKEYHLGAATGDRVCTICGHAEWIQRKPVTMAGFVHDCPECKTKDSMTLLVTDGLHHCSNCGHKQPIESLL